MDHLKTQGLKAKKHKHKQGTDKKGRNLQKRPPI